MSIKVQTPITGCIEIKIIVTTEAMKIFLFEIKPKISVKVAKLSIPYVCSEKIKDG